MNDLERLIKYGKMDTADAMNRLQGAGIISDNAIFPADVAAADIPAAVEFILDAILKI